MPPHLLVPWVTHRIPVKKAADVAEELVVANIGGFQPYCDSVVNCWSSKCLIVRQDAVFKVYDTRHHDRSTSAFCGTGGAPEIGTAPGGVEWTASATVAQRETHT